MRKSMRRSGKRAWKAVPPDENIPRKGYEYRWVYKGKKQVQTGDTKPSKIYEPERRRRKR